MKFPLDIKNHILSFFQKSEVQNRLDWLFDAPSVHPLLQDPINKYILIANSYIGPYNNPSTRFCTECDKKVLGAYTSVVGTGKIECNECIGKRMTNFNFSGNIPVEIKKKMKFRKINSELILCHEKNLYFFLERNLLTDVSHIPRIKKNPIFKDILLMKLIRQPDQEKSNSNIIYHYNKNIASIFF